MKKILIIGPIHPPYGGISIHIQRLYSLLKNDFDIDFVDESKQIKFEYFNIRSGKIFTYFLKVLKTDIVFIQSGNQFLKNFHTLIAYLFHKKTILTFHGFGKKNSFFVTLFNNFFINLSTKILVVNPEIIFFKKIKKVKTYHRPAYIPPILSTETDLPIFIDKLLNTSKSKNKIIICSNASNLRFYKGHDLYGLDMCIDLSIYLLENKINFIFIFIISSNVLTSVVFKKYQEYILINNLSNNFFLFNESLSFVKILSHSDIFIRATNTDGDALSIREALFLNNIVIASDIVPRPINTIIFKTRDQIDLNHICLNTIKNKSFIIKQQNNEFNDLDENKEFYKKFINDAIFS